MAITNESARLGGAGAGETLRAGSGLRFYPQYTPVSSRLKPAFLRLGYALRDALLSLAERLASRAVRLDDWLWRRGIGV